MKLIKVNQTGLALVTMMLMMIAMGCMKKVNQWDVEPKYAKLFSPLDFAYVKGNNDLATTAQIKYTKIIGADQYVFEFAKGKFQFDSIIKKVVILSDTLTPFASSSTPNRIQYRTIFKGLSGQTGYSVRMRGVDTTTGLASSYSTAYFETQQEQIFKNWTIYTDSIRLSWKPTDNITYIGVFDTIGAFIQKKKLTSTEVDNASAVLKDLTPGSYYRLIMFNGSTIRGSLILKTTGIRGGYIIKVGPDDDIKSLITSAVNEGHTNISLLFDESETFDMADFDIPEDVKSIGFIGTPNASGALPVIKNLEIGAPDLDFGSMLFEQLKMEGKNGFMVYIDEYNSTGKRIEFSRCDLSDYRGLVRIKDNNISVNNIIFNNCLIDNNGGYGVVNVGGSSVHIDTLSFKNSTLTDLETQLMDVRTAVSYIYIGFCTFCNMNKTMNYFLRFDDNHLPLSIETEANIFSGNNAGALVDVSYGDYSSSGLNLSFAGSYKTKDFQINRYDFPGITEYNGTTYDLFVDPDNANYTIKPEAGFGGYGTAGDPRWYPIH